MLRQRALNASLESSREVSALTARPSGLAAAGFGARDARRVRELVQPRRADRLHRFRVERLDRHLLVHLEEAQHLAQRALVVGAVVVVDQHQHVLAREDLVEAAQLLGVAHVLGVQQRVRVVAASRYPPARRAVAAPARSPCGSRARTRRCSRPSAGGTSAGSWRARAGSRSSRASGCTCAIPRERRASGCTAARPRPRAGPHARPRTATGSPRACAAVSASRPPPRSGSAGRYEEPRLLHVRHEDLRMPSQHLVQRGRAALGVAHDEEVRHAFARHVWRFHHRSRRLTPSSSKPTWWASSWRTVRVTWSRSRSGSWPKSRRSVSRKITIRSCVLSRVAPSPW